MTKWKPWEKLELLKSAYYEYEPEIKKENKYDYSVAAIDGDSQNDPSINFFKNLNWW